MILVLAAVAGGVYYVMTQGERAITLTGIVTTDDVIASAQIAGRLDKLLVTQGDTVKRGQLLAVVEPARSGRRICSFTRELAEAGRDTGFRSPVGTEISGVAVAESNRPAQANLASAQRR